MRYWIILSEFPPFFGGGIATYGREIAAAPNATLVQLARARQRLGSVIASGEITSCSIVRALETSEIVHGRHWPDAYRRDLLLESRTLYRGHA
jgi:hypothetical protein